MTDFPKLSPSSRSFHRFSSGGNQKLAHNPVGDCDLREGGIVCGASEDEDSTRVSEVILEAEFKNSVWFDLSDSLTEGLCFFCLEPALPPENSAP